MDEKSLEERKLEIAEIRAAVASAHTDKSVRLEEVEKGRKARLNGDPIDACPWKSGLTRYWWLEGYNSVDEGKDTPQT